jgi:DNA-binding MarR family transcriptional regulator
MASADDIPGRLLDELRSEPGVLLAMLGHEAMRALRVAHTVHGLTPRQVQLLGLLAEGGSTTQSELKELADVDASILVTLLNPLEAGGLVRRERDTEDRRRHVVSLTSAGRRLLAAAADAQHTAEESFLAGLGEDEVERLRASLLALRDSLERGRRPYSPPEGACAGE